MAYALQNLDSGLAGQKTIKPVRAPAEGVNTLAAPAPAPAQMPGMPTYAPSTAQDYQKNIDAWWQYSINGPQNSGTDTSGGSVPAFSGDFIRKNPFDPNGDLYWENNGGAATEANSGNPGDYWGIRSKEYGYDPLFGALINLGVGAVGMAGLTGFNPGAASGAGGGFVSPEALGLEGAVGSETAALGAGQVGALDGAAAVGAGGMSLEAPLSSVLGYENALPAMAGGGTTVGGAVIPGAAGAGLTSQIGGALSSAASWAKANPQLAAMGLSGATSLLGGTPEAPAQPGSGGSGSGGTSNDALIQKLTEQLYGANGSMANAFDYSKIPGLQTSAGDPNAVNQQAIDAAYSKQTGMLDPQFARDQQALEARLAEQGFVPGTPGYDRAMGVFGETRNKAYGSARDSSILQGYQIGQGQFGNQLSNAQLNNNASNSALAQALQERNQPLNELNALKGGQQLAYENQLGQYNADVASSNSKNQALSQLALALGIYLG